MGMVLAIMAYAAFAVFIMRVVVHVALWFKRPWQETGAYPGGGKFKTWRVFLASLAEAFTLRRLLRTNPVLWAGEWVFHMSFVLVLIRHLRYFLTPVPQFVWQMQFAGRIAGYVMPFSLLYIIIVKAIVGRGSYTFPYNYFLLITLFLISGLGVLMTTALHPDIVAVKEYMMSALKLGSIGKVPDSLPFTAHFILALILLVYLPTHIFAAPFTLYEAKKREKTLRRILHD